VDKRTPIYSELFSHAQLPTSTLADRVKHAGPQPRDSCRGKRQAGMYQARGVGTLH